MATAALAGTANERATSADTNSPRTLLSRRQSVAVGRGRWAGPKPHHAMEAERGRKSARGKGKGKGIRRHAAILSINDAIG